MLNEEVARIFERMAHVLAFKGEDRFRVMAYVGARRFRSATSKKISRRLRRQANSKRSRECGDSRAADVPGDGREQPAANRDGIPYSNRHSPTNDSPANHYDGRARRHCLRRCGCFWATRRAQAAFQRRAEPLTNRTAHTGDYESFALKRRRRTGLSKLIGRCCHTERGTLLPVRAISASKYR